VLLACWCGVSRRFIILPSQVRSRHVCDTIRFHRCCYVPMYLLLRSGTSPLFFIVLPLAGEVVTSRFTFLLESLFSLRGRGRSSLILLPWLVRSVCAVFMKEFRSRDNWNLLEQGLVLNGEGRQCNSSSRFCSSDLHWRHLNRARKKLTFFIMTGKGVYLHYYSQHGYFALRKKQKLERLATKTAKIQLLAALIRRSSQVRRRRKKMASDRTAKTLCMATIHHV